MFLYCLYEIVWKVLKSKLNWQIWRNSGRSSHHWIGHTERIPMRMLPVHKAAWTKKENSMWRKQQKTLHVLLFLNMPGLTTLTTQTFFKVRFNIQVIFLIFQRLGKQKKKTKSKTWKLWQTAHGLDDCNDCNDCKTISMESRRDGEDYGLQNSDYTAVAAERVSRRRALNLHATRIPGLQDRRVSQGDPKSKTEKNISSKEYHRTCISIYIYDDFVRSFHDENRKHSHCQGQWIAGCLKLVPCATSTPKLQWTIFQLLHVHLLILGIPPLEELWKWGELAGNGRGSRIKTHVWAGPIVAGSGRILPQPWRQYIEYWDVDLPW